MSKITLEELTERVEALEAAIEVIDAHDHSPGKGAPLQPAFPRSIELGEASQASLRAQALDEQLAHTYQNDLANALQMIEKHDHSSKQTRTIELPDDTMDQLFRGNTPVDRILVGSTTFIRAKKSGGDQ